MNIFNRDEVDTFLRTASLVDALGLRTHIRSAEEPIRKVIHNEVDRVMAVYQPIFLWLEDKDDESYGYLNISTPREAIEKIQLAFNCFKAVDYSTDKDKIYIAMCDGYDRDYWHSYHVPKELFVEMSQEELIERTYKFLAEKYGTKESHKEEIRKQKLAQIEQLKKELEL